MAIKNVVDEQFDKAMRELLADASLTGTEIDDIADSPALWWSIKRDIENQKPARSMPWPPVEKIRLWMAAGVPAVTFAAVLLAFFLFMPSDQGIHVAHETQTPPVAEVSQPGPDRAEPVPAVGSAKQLAPKRPASKRSVVKAPSPTVARQNEGTEIKSEFIALSYAGDASSGQVIRVKVPSEMMVSVGLVQSVAKPSALVDAEVVVGDDGLTRAIRFIRQ